MAWLWLMGANSSPNETHNAISAAPSGMSWLSSLQGSAASAASGKGLMIATVPSSVSAAIGVAGAINWQPRPFLAVAIVLNLAYWVIGQGLGGVFTGFATDPNSGPAFILLALMLYSLTPIPQRAPGRIARVAAPSPPRSAPECAEG